MTASNDKIKQRYNLALFPQDANFISENIRLAKENFNLQAQDYLLGDNAWPHITLCQFESEPGEISEIWSAVAPLALKPLLIHLAQFYIWLYEGNYWVGLATQREPALIALQLSVNEVLNNLKIKSNQPHSTYFPHITWARCSGETPPTIKILPDPTFWSAAHSFKLSLGESSAYGVYRKQLFASDR